MLIRLAVPLPSTGQGAPVAGRSWNSSGKSQLRCMERHSFLKKKKGWKADCQETDAIRQHSIPPCFGLAPALAFLLGQLAFWLLFVPKQLQHFHRLEFAFPLAISISLLVKFWRRERKVHSECFLENKMRVGDAGTRAGRSCIYRPGSYTSQHLELWGFVLSKFPILSPETLHPTIRWHLLNRAN